MKLTIIVIILIVLGLFGWAYIGTNSIKSPNIKQTVQEKVRPLEKYTYENLTKAQFKPAEITLGEIIEETPTFTSQVFFMDFDPQISSGKTKKVSGVINFPKQPGTYPVIIQSRGFIPPEDYFIGAGTIRTGQVLAQNGFITVAPDFLGYGRSDYGEESSLEDRFQTYVTILTLLESIPNLNDQLSTINIQLSADPNRVGLWGHSNGGQITLTVLEVTGKNYPTALWAPVSKPFPYSILYYTDEFDDHGKALRKAIAGFEEDYDVENYSLTNFIDRINAPIQLHQGGADDAVPQRWSNQLADELEEKEKDVEYFVYPGDDHNFALGSWNTVVSHNIAFYREMFNRVGP